MSEFAIGEHVRVVGDDLHRRRTGVIVDQVSVGKLADDPRFYVQFDGGFGRGWVRGVHLERVEVRVWTGAQGRK